MTSLLERITSDLTASLRARDSLRTTVLRSLKNNLKNTAIANRVSETELSDEATVAIVRQEVKRRKESVLAFEAGGRSDLAEHEKQELAVLEGYLPASMSKEAIESAIRDVVSEEKLEAPYVFGKLMGLVVKKIAGRASGDEVKEAVQNFINSAGK